jgi:ParB-like chromosome segregation protein Spo0J
LSSNTKIEIKISSEYQALVPAQSGHEYQSLKQSINENGFWNSHPIVINSDGIILDGHHRYRACQELAIEPKTAIMQFRDKLQEKLFVINSNLKRRHLNSFQRTELGLRSKSILQEIVKSNQSLGGKGVRNLTPLGRVDLEIGKLAGVSYDTVRKVELILNKNPQELLFRLRSGTESINGAHNKIIKDQRRQELTIKAASKAITTIANCNDRFQLINNDFRRVKELKDNSVDLIFTDPPYAEEDLSIYSDLAKLAYETLVQNGSIVTYLRQYDIPAIIRYMEDAGLTFHWFLGIKLTGPFPRAHDKGVIIKQKPLLWFTKGKRKARTNNCDYIADLIESSSPGERKNFHEWAQSCTEAEQIISKLTLENQIVMDPMMGSGTTGNAALKLRRKFIGVERDPKRFAVAKSNISTPH